MAGPGGAVVGRVSIQVLPDTSSFREKLKSQLAAAVKGVQVDIPVDLETGQALTDLAALNSAIEGVGDLDIDVNTDQVAQASAEIDALGKAMRSATNKAKAFSRTTRAMSRGMFLLVSASALAAPAIGGIATLIAGLPSLLGAAAAGIAAVALGFEGIKNAASSLSDEVESLKDVLSSKFETELASVFEDLADVFPTLEDGLSEVVEGLSDMAQGFADAVSSAEGLQQIGDILQNTGDFFSSLQPMVQNFTSAFLTLADAGAEKFGILSETLNTFAADFNRMINQVTTNGTFKAALGGLNQVLKSVLGLFNQLFRAGLKVMAQIGGPTSDAINAFGGFLKALLPILGTITNTLANVLTPIFKALTPILQALQPLFVALGEIIQATLVPAIQALAPLLLSVANLLSRNSAFIAPLLVSLYALNKAYKIVKKSVTKFKLAQLAMKKQNTKLKTSFDDTLIPSLDRTNKKFDKMNTKVKKLRDNMKKLGTKSVNKVKTGWGRLKKVFTKKGVFAIVIGVVIYLVDLIKSNWTEIVNFLDDTWQKIKDGAVRDWKDIKSAIIDPIINAQDAVHQAMDDLENWIANFFSDAGSWLLQAGQDLVQGLWNGISSAFVDLYNRLSRKVSGIISLAKGILGISSPSTVFREIGQNVSIGFAKGINDSTPDVVKAAAKMTDIGGTAHVGMEAALSVDSEDSLSDLITTALSNWEVNVDREGLAQMVNYTNRLNDRRG